MGEEKYTQSCNMLFEYLRSILYDTEIKQPDFEKLDEPCKKLGAGLKVLQKSVEEMKAYSEGLSKGDLSEENPSRDNFLCANLKNLHANLNHLTWQAKQVAMGDYSQHVSYLGEFSDAFNTMITQLSEREEQLRQEIEKTRKHMKTIEEYNDLFINMALQRNEWIVVADADTREILYSNKPMDPPQALPAGYDNCEKTLSFIDQVLHWQNASQYKVWEVGDVTNGYFRITSLHIEWRGHNAYAHIIENITEDKRAEEKLENRAYYDAGTKIHNRFFFEEYMTKQLKDQEDMILCFIDLDGLKHVNDHFGHNEGDNYIYRFVTEIKSSFRASDLFARIGGDEFVMIFQNTSLEIIEQKIENVRSRFIENSRHCEYPSGFSYGLVNIQGAANKLSMKELLDKADQKMYQYKKKHKRFPVTAKKPAADYGLPVDKVTDHE